MEFITIMEAIRKEFPTLILMFIPYAILNTIFLYLRFPHTSLVVNMYLYGAYWGIVTFKKMSESARLFSMILMTIVIAGTICRHFNFKFIGAEMCIIYLALLFSCILCQSIIYFNNREIE